MAQASQDPNKKYRLPWEALGGATLAAIVMGSWQVGAALGAITLLYIAYAYSNWFNGLS